MADLFNTTEITNEHAHRFILNPHIPECGSNGKLLLVGLVMLAPHYFEKRETIRQTWANRAFYKSEDMRVLFVMGQSDDAEINSRLRNESQTHGDIIQEDYLDSYFNITIKVMGAYKWVAEYCPNVEFVLRINDHVIVNRVNLIRFLKETNRADKTIWGVLLEKSTPKLDPKHRWHIPKEEYGHSRFLPYMQGTVVMMTGDLASKLYNLSRYVYWPRFSVGMEVHLTLV